MTVEDSGGMWRGKYNGPCCLGVQTKSRLSYNFLYQSDVVTYLIWGTIVGLQVFNTFIILTYCFYMWAIAFDQHLLNLPKGLEFKIFGFHEY